MVAIGQPRRGARGGGLLNSFPLWKLMVLAVVATTLILFLGANTDTTMTYSADKKLASLSVRDLVMQSEAAPSETCLVDVVKSNQKSSTTGTNPKQNSTTATVMAMATGYGLEDYQRFVGSLRKTGYQGHIILAVSPVLAPDVEEYLTSKGVNIRKVSYVNCSHPLLSEDELKNGHDKELVTCLHPYPSLKHRWARFPLLRDYLKECSTCTGPVLITDMRDTIFQRDPFGPEAPVVPPNTLQVFQEHYTIRTTHWLADWPIFDCKGVRFDEPMLCSGTTIGTRSAMLEYLRVIHAEMDEWMRDPKCCCFKTNGDDQSMHNYLFYSGKLDHIAVAIPNRMGLVNTVGGHGGMIHEYHVKSKKTFLEMQNKSTSEVHHEKYDMHEDSNGKGNWLGLQYGMTDEEGYFVQFNGERSFIIHQYDRFGSPYEQWIRENKDKLYG